MAPPRGRPPTWVLQRRLCQSIIGKEGTKEYTEYTNAMRKQVLAGVCPPAIHQLFLHYGYGKPVEEIEVVDKTPAESGLADLTEEQLRDRAKRIAMAKFIVGPVNTDDPGDDPGDEDSEAEETIQ